MAIPPWWVICFLSLVSLYLSGKYTHPIAKVTLKKKKKEKEKERKENRAV